MTTAQAAELLHLAPATIRRMARGGKINASYVGGRWLITEDSIADLLAEHSNRETRPRRRRRRAS